MPHQPPKSNNSQQFSLLFETISENIRFTKRRQWMLAYYILLADAGTIGIFITFFKNGDMGLDHVVFFILLPALIIYSFGLYILMAIQKSLYFDRVRLKEITSKLPGETQKILNLSDGIRTNKKLPPFSKDFCPYTLSFIFVMSVGLLYIFACSLEWKLYIAFFILIFEVVIVWHLYKTFKKNAERKTNK